MARPVGADAEATRKRLLDATAQNISQSGVRGTTLRQVAADAGVSLATIHHYFGGKEGLIDACLQETVQTMSDELVPLAGLLTELVEQLSEARDSGSLRLAIEQAVRSGYRLVVRQRQAIRLVTRSYVETGELDPIWRRMAVNPFLEQLSRLLAPTVDQPAAAVRLGLQSLNTLILRFALTEPVELVRMVGLAPDDAPLDDRQRQMARALVEDHLVEMATRILLGEVGR